MSPLLQRALLAATLPCIALWVIYEMAWIPFEYDLESREMEQQLAIRGQALKQQYAALDPAEWEGTVAKYNRTSDDLLALIRETDSDWADLYASIQTDAEEGMLTDSFDSSVAFVLSDGRSILQNEVFYFELETNFDAIFWLFLLTAAVFSMLLLKQVVGSFEKRLQAIADAVDQFRIDKAPTRIPVRGSDLLGEVERRIDSLIGHLEHAIDDLHDSIGTQRDLMHAVAHEFRGPIARLRFASDLVADAADADERAELLVKIDRSIQELDELVSEVLGYSRIRHGGYRLKLASIELGPLMAQVLTKVRAEYPAIEFRLSPENSPGQVTVDPKLLERAVINLARNAGRFARRQVDIATRIDDQEFEIRIADDGPGVAPGKRERIFEPFTRLDASRSRESGGSGLGLAIVMAVSNQHQGTIRCGDSSLGGAEFTLKWPVSTSP